MRQRQSSIFTGSFSEAPGAAGWAEIHRALSSPRITFSHWLRLFLGRDAGTGEHERGSGTPSSEHTVPGRLRAAQLRALLTLGTPCPLRLVAPGAAPARPCGPVTSGGSSRPGPEGTWPHQLQKAKAKGMLGSGHSTSFLVRRADLKRGTSRRVCCRRTRRDMQALSLGTWAQT